MPIQQVRAKINNSWYTLTYNGSSGKYEATIAAPNITSFNVNAGHYYPVTIEATNLAGTIATKDDTDGTIGNSLKLTVKELTKPTISIVTPSAGAYLASNTPSISIQVRDEVNGSGIKISSLQIKIDGGAAINNVSPGVTVTPATNGYDITYVPQSALSDGSHAVTVDIQDNDGNNATQATRSFTVDTVPPELSITSPSTDGTYTANTSLIVTGTTNDSTSSPVSVTLKLNGVDQGAITVDGSGNWSKGITLAAGLNTIVAKATDLAGKYTEVTRTINLDTSTPAISAVTITPNPVNAGANYVIAVTVA